MIELSLSTQLTAKVLGWISGWTTDGLGHLGHIDNDGLDAIALAFDFGGNAGHFVPIENIGDIAVNVNCSHFEWFSISRLCY